MNFKDRKLLAITSLQMEWEERGGFISDDSVLDAADRWSIGGVEAYLDDKWGDYAEMRDQLFEHLTSIGIFD